MKPVLTVYVARHCLGTAEATRLAAEAKQKLPAIQVRVAALDELPATDLAGIPATPAYFLDGRLLFLGNPRFDELAARIALCSRKGTDDDG